MAALTKADIADRISAKGKLNKQDAKDFVEDFFGIVSDLLVEGNDLKFSGFGVFYLRDKPERVGRNPKTGEEVPISARRVVTFRPGQKLRALVESQGGTLGEELELDTPFGGDKGGMGSSSGGTEY